jgi:ribonuclease T1
VSARPEAAARIPEHVIAVYQHVLRTGHAPPGHVGGRVFENREQRLPSGGNYHEFDVNPKIAGRNRGAERLIVDLDRGAGA